MKIYGLTGGIGSGKSRVATRFADHGIPTIDMDKLGHTVIARQGPAEKDVLKAFGTDILTDGTIDRKALGKIVFAHKEALATLNNIVHPLIRQELQKKCAELKDEGHPIILVEAALLAEGTEFEPWLDGLILVLCREEIRAQRIADSGRMTKTEAAQRIAAQVPPESKMKRATYIIQNDGTEEEFMKQVDEIQREL